MNYRCMDLFTSVVFVFVSLQLRAKVLYLRTYLLGLHTRRVEVILPLPISPDNFNQKGCLHTPLTKSNSAAVGTTERGLSFRDNISLLGNVISGDKAKKQIR